MRRAVLLLSVMAAVILLAGGVALAASELDQQQEGTSTGIGLDATYPMAQIFTAGRSGALDKVSAPAWRSGTTEAGEMVVSIQTLDESGLPSGTVLGSGSRPIDDFETSPPGSWMDVSLAQPAPVSAGTKYALVVSSAHATPTGASFYVWGVDWNDPYPGGDAYGRNQSGQWSLRHDNGVPMDFAFRTFVTAPDVTAPEVKRVVPAEDATGIAPGANVIARFSEDMKAKSINVNTVRLLKTGTKVAIAAEVTYDATARRATLDPDTKLERGARYKAVVNTGVRDLAGNSMQANKVWYFTTASR